LGKTHDDCPKSAPLNLPEQAAFKFYRSSFFIMALLPILEFPDPRLHKIAEPVAVVTPEIRKLVRDLADTMYAAPGIGLAATQVDAHKRVIVIDTSETKNELLVLINPEIVWSAGDAENEEGCLSVPGYFDLVRRAERIRFRALDAEGKWYEREADELLAVCVQHEMDHLLGKVFVEYLSPLKQQRLHAKARKRQRLAG
jgi:peptide deformylase